jgi:hypothetical protein
MENIVNCLVIIAVVNTTKIINWYLRRNAHPNLPVVLASFLLVGFTMKSIFQGSGEETVRYGESRRKILKMVCIYEIDGVLFRARRLIRIKQKEYVKKVRQKVSCNNSTLLLYCKIMMWIEKGNSKCQFYLGMALKKPAH